MKPTDIAKEVIDIESRAIEGLKNHLSEEFTQAVEQISKSQGKLIIIGIGKSGLIGKKIAATLASTGTPSFFIHPTEAYHGDLGMIEADDIVLLISYSGETDELLRIIPFLKNQNNLTISMSSNKNSTLSKNTDFHINIYVSREACPLSLAPTSSTTATLVMGDALAVALMKNRDFQDEEFAKFHPGGTLGRRLLTKVKDVMKSQNLPICDEETTIKEIISLISSSKLGLAIACHNKKIVGIITDGDIRRAMDENQENFFDLKAKDILTKNPKSIDKDAKLTQAHNQMTNNKINSLLVTEDGSIVGVIQMYDLGI